jgi:hypothetical protein
MKKNKDIELLEESLDALARMECQFFACDGPTLRPIHMVTCFRCELVARLAARLGCYRKRAERGTEYDFMAR